MKLRLGVSTLVELLRLRAEEEPDFRTYTFLLDGEQAEAHVTYGELDRRARAVAARLQEMGAAGERALLLYAPGLEYIVSLFGCFYAGVVAVPVYPPRRNKPTPRLQSIIADCHPSVVLTTPDIVAAADGLAALMPELEGMRWVATEEVPDAAAEAWTQPDLGWDSVAFLQYTSGSTGNPKGVMVSHGNLIHNFHVIETLTGFTPEERSVIWLPPYHDMGLIGGILQPMYTRYWAALMAPVAFVQRPARWLEAITRYRATTSGGPNFAYDLCVHAITPEDRERLDLSSWTLAFNGAEPVRSETLDSFVRVFGPHGFRRETFYPCYGLAEGTLMVTGSVRPAPPELLGVDPDGLQRHRVVVSSGEGGTARLVGSGRVAPDEEVRIVDPETFRECPADRVGEVWVRGPSVTLGYWGREEETERTFGARIAGTGEGPFMRTGDLGFLADDELYITGRVKDLIIIRGRNHYPHDIEQTSARSHPALRPGGTAAFGIEHGGEERLVIVQEVARQCTGPDLEEIAGAVRAGVAREHELQVYAVALVKPGVVPKTSSGKIQRLLCRSEFLKQRVPVLGVSVLDDGPVASKVDGAPSLGREALEAAEPAERAGMLEEFLHAHAARVLGVSAARIDRGQPLVALGLDSLMAAELKTVVETSLGVALPLTRLLEVEGIRALAAEVLDEMRLASPAEAGAVHAGHARMIVARPEELPLSYAQERLWFLDALQPGSAAYNIPLALRVSGALDADTLARCFGEVVRRHEALRTVFGSVEGRPVQTVRPAAPWTLELDDVSGLPADEREAAARRIAGTEAAAPFDLSTGPLLRTRLVRLAADDHLLVVVMHHIVGDGWSAGVLVRELGALYPALRAGERSPLAPLPTQYADWAIHQREWLRSETVERQLGYWRARLTGVPTLDLPADRPRPPVQSFRGATHRFEVPAETAEGIRSLARAEGATLFMALLAGWKLLLSRYSGQHDVAVGTPVSNRDGAEVAGLVGLFVNTLVLRTEIDPAAGFRELLARVRAAGLEAYAHQELPFEKLVEEIQPERDLSRNPLFQVMFGVQNTSLEPVSADGITLVPATLDSGTAKLDLTLFVWERAGGGLSATLEYATDLFDAATAERMATHYTATLRAVAADPDGRVAAVDFLSAAERQQLVSGWNATEAELPGDRPVHALVAGQAARTPDAVAVACGAGSLTYAELEARSNRLARCLRVRGVGTETRVGLYLERGVEMVVGMLGVHRAGGAYVPLDPGYPRERLEYMLRDSGATVLLTQSSLAGNLPAEGIATVRVDADRDAIARESAEALDLPVSPDGLAYLIYTSGSTGRPKGVMNTHRALVNLLESMRREVGTGPDDVLLAVTPLSFDIAALEVFLPLVSGSRLVVATRETVSDGAKLLGEMAATGVTVMQATPATWYLLLGAGWEGDGRLKILCGGEALPPELAGELLRRGSAAWNVYGPTETTIWSTAERLRAAGTPVSVGRPLANTRVYVLDGELNPVPVGVPGTLHIGGAGLARGYHGRADLTAERFLPDPFAPEAGARVYDTGDLARFRADGRIEVLGRADQQVKVRGFRIELGEIEAALEAHPALARVAVAATSAGVGEKRLVAYLVPANGSAPPAAGLRAWLRERLPEYMVPSLFVTLDTLPLTPNGKVDRRALPAPTPDPGETAGYVAPRTPTEEVLAGVWAETLGVERVGVHDNFFDLGGHSLLGAQLIARTRDATGAELPLRTLFDAATVARFAERVDEALRGARGTVRPPLLPVARGGELPLSFAQERLWFLDRLRPGSAAYTMPAALRFTGPLDTGALRRALDRIVERHEALRSRFVRVRGRPVQVVDEPRPLEWTLADVSHLAGEEKEAELRRLALEEAARPFDLETGPLIRAGLVRGGDEDHLLLLSIHHIACDAWSMGVLAREMIALYEAFSGEREADLPALPVQYVDFAAWQREYLAGPALEAQLDYWRGRLAGLGADTEIPTDRPRPETQTFTGAVLSTALGADTSARVRALARAEQLTPYMVLLAAFQAALRHHVRSDRVVVGTDVASRAGEVAGLIGLFVNQLVLATDLSGDPVFREVLHRVRETTLGAYAHQDVPFNLLVEAVNPVRDLSRNPLFQVMFVFDNTPLPELRFAGVEMRVMDLQLAGAPFDLSVLVSEEHGEFRCVWRYNPELFNAVTVQRVAESFATMARAATASPDAPLAALLDIVTDTEQARRAADLDRLKEARSLRFSRIGAARRNAPEESGEPEPVA
ncbi:MAG TPA: amino acid adenylation domain-containing protein [Longimicrobiaceae bacterium]|nr:amino acid adenylation domain-containing protein [Longimicrobiaceae bacterium]